MAIISSSRSNLSWSILAIIIAAAVLVFAIFAAGDQPPEVANNRRVKFHLWCMTSMRNRNHTCYQWEINCREPDLIGCRYTYDEIQYRYEKTGYLSEDYVEALRIYHNYNQTDVDIDICKLSRSRCPDRIKALNARCTSTDIKSGAFGGFCCRPRDIEFGRHGC